jgi:hypothetical protein
MPLSEHEQRILEEIERKLSEEDPRFVRTVGQPFGSHAAKRMRLGVLLFIVGFFMLLLFPVAGWGWFAAIAGFGVMLVSALVVYHYLKQMGREQLQSMGTSGRFSLTAYIARLADRLRGGGGGRPPASD